MKIVLRISPGGLHVFAMRLIQYNLQDCPPPSATRVLFLDMANKRPDLRDEQRVLSNIVSVSQFDYVWLVHGLH